MPSIDGRHSRACVNRYRPVCGHVMLPLRPGLSAPFHPLLPVHRFRSLTGLQEARSPSLPIVLLRAFHADYRRTLLWIRLPPNDFCNCSPSMRGHTLERPILAFARISMLRWSYRTHSRIFRCLLPGPSLPLAKKLARATSRDSPSNDARSACCKRSRSKHRRKLLPSLDAACGRRPNPTATCGGGRWTKALDCTGQETLSEGPSRALCFRKRRG